MPTSQSWFYNYTVSFEIKEYEFSNFVIFQRCFGY